MSENHAPLETEFGETVVDRTEATAEPSPLEEQLAAANARADENYAKFLLVVADFENYKKRMQRDLDAMLSARRRMLLERFLPVLDNLERALEFKGDGEKLRGGIEQTLRGFEAVLTGEGVKAIEVKGAAFDPRLAEAVGTANASDVAEDTVVEVIEKGYNLGDELLRPAKVIVAKHPTE